ncbi:unnamed protein product, partial [Linum tenue]
RVLPLPLSCSCSLLSSELRERLPSALTDLRARAARSRVRS